VRGEVLVSVRACGICGSDRHGTGMARRRTPHPADHHGPRSRWRNHRPRRRRNRLERRRARHLRQHRILRRVLDKCKSGYINLCANRKVLGVVLRRLSAATAALPEQVVLPTRILYRIARFAAVLKRPPSPSLSSIASARRETSRKASKSVKPSPPSRRFHHPRGSAVVVGAGLDRSAGDSSAEGPRLGPRRRR